MFHISETDYKEAYEALMAYDEEFIDSVDAFRMGWDEACRVAEREADQDANDHYRQGYDDGAEEAENLKRDDLISLLQKVAELEDYQLCDQTMRVLKRIAAELDVFDPAIYHIEARRLL
jgi:hypothetical protein